MSSVEARRAPAPTGGTGGAARSFDAELADGSVWPRGPSSRLTPAVGEVIFVQEALTNAEAKVGQAYVSGIVTEADPAVMPDAVLAAVDDEAVQVLVGPAQDSLQSVVEIGDGAVAANEQAAPDQRADAAQDDAQLVHHRVGVRGRLRHCAIMEPAAISPVVPSPLVLFTLPTH